MKVLEDLENFLTSNLENIQSAEKQNDEVVQLKELVKELQDVNKKLNDDKYKLSKDLEENTSLINSLQKEVEATSKLLNKSEIEKAYSLKLNEDSKQTIAQYEHTCKMLHLDVMELHSQNEILECEVAELHKEIVDGEKTKSELKGMKSREQILTLENQKLNEILKLSKSNCDAPNKYVHNDDPTGDDPDGYDLDVDDLDEEYLDGDAPDADDPDADVPDTDATDGNYPHGDELDENDPIFDDPIVKLCRPKLMRLEFGWIKFTKRSAFRPGFLHPKVDGIKTAQRVSSVGYVDDRKEEYLEFKKKVPAYKKLRPAKSALKNFNKKFKFKCN